MNGRCNALSWSLALKATDNAATISNLIFLSPFLSLQFIHFVLGETIHWTTYAGLITIIAGIVFQQVLHRRAAVATVSATP